MRSRRHAARVVVPVPARRRRNAGDVRPVPVLVEAGPAVVSEVSAGNDAAAQFRHVGHARVDDGNADAGAGHARRAERGQPAVDLVGARRLHRGRHLRRHELVARERVDLRVAGHCLELVAGDLEHRAALQPLPDLQAVPRHNLVDARLRTGEDDRRRATVARPQLLDEIAGQARTAPLALGRGVEGTEAHERGRENEHQARP